MAIQPERGDYSDINPFIAFTDVAINFLLILTIIVALLVGVSQYGWERVRYRTPMEQFEKAVKESLAVSQRPNLLPIESRNDPPGVQRWVFSGQTLFQTGSAQLTVDGRRKITLFAKVLGQHKDKWRRVRIEGHTRAARVGEPETWVLSAQRAAVVAEVLHTQGRIARHMLAIAGRGGQALLYPKQPNHPENERVEIVIEFSLKTATGQPVK